MILRESLIQHEGLRLKVYKDTLGIETIGVGRNLRDRGITQEEAMLLLEHDIQIAEGELYNALPWMGSLDPARRDVFIELSFALGMPKLREFRRMLLAGQNKDWDVCANELLNSLWAEQVGKAPGERAHTLATILRTGPLA